MSGCLLSKLVLRDIRWEFAFPSLLFCLSISDKNSSVNIAGRHAGCLQSLSNLICLWHVHTHTLQFFSLKLKACTPVPLKKFFVYVVHRHFEKKKLQQAEATPCDWTNYCRVLQHCSTCRGHLQSDLQEAQGQLFFPTKVLNVHRQRHEAVYDHFLTLCPKVKVLLPVLPFLLGFTHVWHKTPITLVTGTA